MITDSSIPGNFGTELWEDLQDEPGLFEFLDAAPTPLHMPTKEELVSQIEKMWTDRLPKTQRVLYAGRHCITYGFIFEKGLGFQLCGSPLCHSCTTLGKLLNEEFNNL